MALTKLQQAFIEEYTRDPTCGQAEAARRAGYGAKRAKITSYELMRNPEIQREIERRMTRKLSQVERSAGGAVTKESVLEDMAELEDSIKRAGIGAWQSAALLKIIEMRGKFLKMFTDRVELGVDDVLVEKLLEGRKRAGLAEPQPPTIEAAEVPALPEAALAQ